MSKIIISFLALNNDFDKNTVSIDSPNYNIHKFYYLHDKHYFIYTSDEHKKKVDVLINKLSKDFPDHNIEAKYIYISDPINIVEIRDKLFVFLNQLKGNEIDIFMSPGTPSMQIAWFLLHLSNIADTRLIQGRKAGDSKSGKPEFYEIYFEKSTIPYSAVLKHSFPGDPETKYPIGSSIKPIFEKASKLAATDNVTVLIRGESGTGKEYLARFIHDSSERKKKKFIAVNCSSLNDELLESRLFGHKKGSFTGAFSDQVGFFESAEGGTIFLDEIGDISARLQQSLLRVFQESEILRLGESTPRKINVRIIAATNKDLEKLCSEDKFRWDLYYRLNVVELELPPLRMRSEKDFDQLFQYLNKEKGIKFNKQVLRYSKESLVALKTYYYPGNIRELENLIENLYVFNDDKIGIKDLPGRLFQVDSKSSLKWEDITRVHFKKVLELSGGNKSKAAKLLGCSLNTLKKYL